MEYKYAVVTTQCMQNQRGDWVIGAYDPSSIGPGSDIKYFQISQCYTERNLGKIQELSNLHPYEMEPLFGSCKPGDIIQYVVGEPMDDFAFNIALVGNKTVESEVKIRLGHNTKNRAVITKHENKDSMYKNSLIYAYNPGGDGYIAIKQDAVVLESQESLYNAVVDLVKFKSCSVGDIIRYASYTNNFNNSVNFALTNDETIERMTVKKPGRLSIGQIWHSLWTRGNSI